MWSSNSFHFTLVLRPSVAVSHAYSWTSTSPTNGSLHYACVGDSVTLAWSIVTTSSERVNDVEWLFVDDSKPSLYSSLGHSI